MSLLGCYLTGGVCRKKNFGQAEVENLDVTAFGNKDIRRLDVAVDDSLFVGGIECIGDLNRQREQEINLDGFSGDAIFESHPVKKFHDDEPLPVMLGNPMNRANVWMVQG